MALFGNKAVQSRIDEAVKIIDKMTESDFIGHIETSGTDIVVPLMRALKNTQTTFIKKSEEAGRDKESNAELKALLDLTDGARSSETNRNVFTGGCACIGGRAV